MSANMTTADEINNSFTACQYALQDFFVDSAIGDEAAVKRSKNYFDWISVKTELVKKETKFKLPCSALPGKISEYIYNYLSHDRKAIVDKYYRKSSGMDGYVLNAKKSDFSQAHIATLIHSLVLRRGHVVWVNFGFNVGSEFGGRHPALILKNAKTVLTVLPLSSQTPNHPDFNVIIDIVYGFPLMPRWGNVTRIVPVSVMRIDFESNIGSVKNEVLRNVSEKIKSHGVK